MPRFQLTRIEELDRKQPGLKLELAVRRMLHRGDTLEEIRQFIREKTGQTLPLSTISNYKQERWLKEQKRIQALREASDAIIAALGEHGVSVVTQAEIFKQVDQAMRAGAELDPHFLLKEQRLWQQHAAKLEEIQNEKKSLELKIEQHQKEREAISRAVGDEKADSDTIRQRIREIYGLGSPGDPPV